MPDEKEIKISEAREEAKDLYDLIETQTETESLHILTVDEPCNSIEMSNQSSDHLEIPYSINNSLPRQESEINFPPAMETFDQFEESKESPLDIEEFGLKKLHTIKAFDP